MTEKRSEAVEQTDEVTAIKRRLRELCESKWGRNLTRMARDLRLPQPALWKIIRADQPPNAQLLMALATCTTVNLHWLITGRGPRSLEGNAGVVSGAAVAHPNVPVARAVLPGPPRRHGDLLADESTDPLAVLTPTQYWLRIDKAHPVLRFRDEQLAPGDWLLLETDRAQFPPPDDLEDKLVVAPVAPVAGRAVTAPRLAKVESVEDEILTIDTFDLGRLDPSQIEEEIVVRELPDGQLLAYRQPVLKAQPGKGGRRGTPPRPVEDHELDYNLLDVRYTDLLAVCLLSIRPR